MDWILFDGWCNDWVGLLLEVVYIFFEMFGLWICLFGVGWEFCLWLCIFKLLVLECCEIWGDVKKFFLLEMFEEVFKLVCLLCMWGFDWLDDGWVFCCGVLGDLGWVVCDWRLLVWVFVCCLYWSDFWWSSLSWFCILKI